MGTPPTVHAEPATSAPLSLVAAAAAAHGCGGAGVVLQPEAMASVAAAADWSGPTRPYPPCVMLHPLPRRQRDDANVVHPTRPAARGASLRHKAAALQASVACSVGAANCALRLSRYADAVE